MRQLRIIKQVTNREASSLDKYLLEIGRIKLLSSEDEVLLSQEILKGSEHALNKLVRANLRFVISVAKQYQNQGMPLPDLINEGNLGLIKAANRFDSTKGFKFISYAVWWIRQAILQALCEHARLIKLPQNKVGSINRINKLFIRLEQEYQREPAPEEIAAILKLNEKFVDLSLQNNGFHISLDAPISEDEENENNMYDICADSLAISPDKRLMKGSLTYEIDRFLRRLDCREKEILTNLFGLNGTEIVSLEDISFHHSITKERVRQIRDEAIRKLKKMKCQRILKPFLG